VQCDGSGRGDLDFHHAVVRAVDDLLFRKRPARGRGGFRAAGMGAAHGDIPARAVGAARGTDYLQGSFVSRHDAVRDGALQPTGAYLERIRVGVLFIASVSGGASAFVASARRPMSVRVNGHTIDEAEIEREMREHAD